MKVVIVLLHFFSGHRRSKCLLNHILSFFDNKLIKQKIQHVSDVEEKIILLLTVMHQLI
jgi:hypothetical protein